MLLRVLYANRESSSPMSCYAPHRAILLVFLVLLACGMAKVIPSVVLPIAIYVVYLVGWVLPFHIEASQSVGGVLVAVDLDAPVSSCPEVSGPLASLRPSFVFSPEEVSGGRDVIKKRHEAGLSACGIWGFHMGTIA